MQPREEALSRRERTELQGYVSWTTELGRATLFIVAVALIGFVCWRVQRWFSIAAPVWLVPTVGAAIFIFLRAGRWTGGRVLRDRIREDLQANKALVHHVAVREAIVFEESEDEGPIVFVHTEDGETLVFVGQDLANEVSRGFPWRAFEIRESAASRRFLRMKRVDGARAACTTKPPLSAEQFTKLGLASVVRWQRLDIPFHALKQIS